MESEKVTKKDNGGKAITERRKWQELSKSDEHCQSTVSQYKIHTKETIVQRNIHTSMKDFKT